MKLAFLFPGQGSQHPGMGRELAEAFPESRRVFDEADEALGQPLSRTCFEGSEETLALTENTQPAVLTVSVAALRALESRVAPPVAAAGHSLGEYSALVCAGSLLFSEAVRLVRLRGRFMQEAVPVGEGAMAAILGLPREQVEALCREASGGRVVSAANLNGPGQVVIAGHADAVGRAMEAAKRAGARRAVPLPVSAPFHCALMRPAAQRLAVALHEIEVSDPAFAVYTNVDARPAATGEAAREALVRQVASPVRWEELVDAMGASGVDTFVELGPGRVLSGLVRRIRKDACVLSVSDPAGLENAARELGAAV